MSNMVKKHLISLLHKTVLIRAIIKSTTAPKVSLQYKRLTRNKYLYQFHLNFTRSVKIVMELSFLMPPNSVKKV